MAPNGRLFGSYNCWKLDWSAESEIWADYTFRHKSGIWQILAMTSPEILNMKFPVNELSFPLVTHMVDSDARFDSYGNLKSGQGAGQILDRLDIQSNDHVLRVSDA
jgi:hypothetical protein